MASADVVAILTRAPASGGKTRLFAALGIPADESLLTALLLDTIDGVRPAGARVVVAVTPAWAIDQVALLVPDVGIIAQGDGTLGDRMRGAMQVLFDRGARRVALIGSDLPEISPAAIVDAFAALDRDPDAVVLGPALDGGYYLVAASAVPPIFDDIEWGRASVLTDTRARAAVAGVPVREIAPLEDVDTPAGLRAAARRRPDSRTALWVARHLE